MPPLVAVILNNLPMLFTDATLVVEWAKSLKARGVDVEAQVAASMARASEDTKRLLETV